MEAMKYMERQGLIEVGGKDVTVVGPDMEIGQQAPDFIVIKPDYSQYEGLKETAGIVRILAAVPSIDTSTCESETIRFENETDTLGDEIKILVISMDLPPALKRFTEEFEIHNVQMLSDHNYADFGSKYGTLMKELRVLRRAVFVVDQDDRVVYADYMDALGDLPDFDQVFKAAKSAL